MCDCVYILLKRVKGIHQYFHSAVHFTMWYYDHLVLTATSSVVPTTSQKSTATAESTASTTVKSSGMAVKASCYL